MRIEIVIKTAEGGAQLREYSASGFQGDWDDVKKVQIALQKLLGATEEQAEVLSQTPKDYLAKIGAKGGRKSKRELSSEDAKGMVKQRESKRQSARVAVE